MFCLLNASRIEKCLIRLTRIYQGRDVEWLNVIFVVLPASRCANLMHCTWTGNTCSFARNVLAIERKTVYQSIFSSAPAVEFLYTGSVVLHSGLVFFCLYRLVRREFGNVKPPLMFLESPLFFYQPAFI